MIFSRDEYADLPLVLLVGLLLLCRPAGSTSAALLLVRRCHHQKKRSTEATTTTAITDPTIAPTGEAEVLSSIPLASSIHIASWQRSHVCAMKTQFWPFSHFGHSLASSGHSTHSAVDSDGDSSVSGLFPSPSGVSD